MTEHEKPPPKKRPKAPRPVESFGPELLSALLKGAHTDGISFQLPYRSAIRFRLRVHQLREAMRKSGHDMYSLVSRVGIHIEWPDETPIIKKGRYYAPEDTNTLCIIRLTPNDSEFASALRAAGIDPGFAFPEPNPDPGSDQPEATISDLELMLRDLK